MFSKMLTNCIQYTYIYIYVYIYIHIYICTHGYICICIYTYIYTYTHVHKNTWHIVYNIYRSIFMYTHIYIIVFKSADILYTIYTCICICKHIYVYTFSKTQSHLVHNIDIYIHIYIYSQRIASCIHAAQASTPSRRSSEKIDGQLTLSVSTWSLSFPTPLSLSFYPEHVLIR